MDLSQYKVGVVQSIEDCGSCKGSGKVLRSLKVQIAQSDDDDCFMSIVTSANNVRESSRVVVAPAGSSVLNDEGELIQVKKASVGGVVSEGMLCDSYMLGWKGGAKGLAAILPDSFEIGSVPPESKPRGKEAEGGNSEAIAPAAPGLFEKKLTKEEKKKLAEEKRKAKKAAKEAKTTTSASEPDGS